MAFLVSVRLDSRSYGFEVVMIDGDAVLVLRRLWPLWFMLV